MIKTEIKEKGNVQIETIDLKPLRDMRELKGYYQDDNEDALIMWTENIFYDKFKNKFSENKEKLKQLIKVMYE